MDFLKALRDSFARQRDEGQLTAEENSLQYKFV